MKFQCFSIEEHAFNIKSGLLIKTNNINKKQIIQIFFLTNRCRKNYDYLRKKTSTAYQAGDLSEIPWVFQIRGMTAA